MIKSLKEYASVARLWVIEYEKSILELGITHTLGGTFTSKADLYSAIESQLKTILNSKELEEDISFESALLILKGQNVA